MYSLSIRPHLRKKLEKLAHRNKKLSEIVLKKSKEVITNPHHYKNLRKPLQHLKRVHVDKHFVLVFSVDEHTKSVILENLEHHDKIYR